jgi:tetratricopeptide (TPR) repeat protein
MQRVIFASILFLSTQILFSQSALEYWNMGQEAQRIREYEKAIEYYEKAGEIWLREGVYKNYLVTLGNVGVLYKTLEKYELSLDTFFKLYIAAQEIGGQSEVPYSLQNIGLFS